MKMKQLRQYGFFFLVLIAMFSFVESSNNAVEEQERPIVVMAYYVPEKEYNPEQLPLNQLTHILFSFTHIIDGKMKFKKEGK
ncbi:MAG: hypothetical protein QM485_09260 [Flavobacteriaceae bacterium]